MLGRVLLLGLFALFPLIAMPVVNRVRLLIKVSKNDPENLVPINAFSSYEIKFAQETRNCEDVLMVESQSFAIFSCDPGRDKWNTVMGVEYEGPMQKGGLFLYEYASDEAPLVAIELAGYPLEDFHPLGVAYDEASAKLFVVNHSKEGSRIEVFTLDTNDRAKPRATHQQSIVNPRIRAPNSIAIINSNELYVTNDHYFLSLEDPWLSHLETWLGAPGGDVVHLNLETLRARTVTNLAFANGVEMLNDTTLAVASTNHALVQLYHSDPKTRDVKPFHAVEFPFFVDNLSKDKNGALLVAGHPHPFTFTTFMQTRAMCSYAATENSEFCQKMKAGSWVAEWTAEGGVRDLYANTEFPASTTAVRDVENGIGLVAGLYAKGILRWKE